MPRTKWEQRKIWSLRCNQRDQTDELKEAGKGWRWVCAWYFLAISKWRTNYFEDSKMENLLKIILSFKKYPMVLEWSRFLHFKKKSRRVCFFGLICVASFFFNGRKHTDRWFRELCCYQAVKQNGMALQFAAEVRKLTLCKNRWWIQHFKHLSL